jgi:hypothetical protein
MAQTQTGGVREQQTVVSVKLDWLAERIPAPTLLKIDVEGAEREVLEGAERLLQSARPFVLCEVAGEAASETAAIFRRNEYVVCDGALTPTHRVRLDDAPWSTIAIPLEKLGDHKRLSRE